jgi:hypothetical protein
MQKSKIKNQNYKLKIILFFVLCSLFYVLPVGAISPTPTVTLNPTPTLSVKLEEKIQEIRDEVKKKVREKIEETKKGMKAAYFGEITAITESTLTITTFKGVSNVRIGMDTVIVGRGNKKIALKDLAIGDYIIAMGYIADNNLLDAKRIVVINKPKVVAREVAFGKVTDISADEKILTVKNEKKNLLYTIEVTDKTTITKKVDGKVKKVKFADITKGDRLVAIGTPTENEEKIIVAKIIHIIPGLALGQEKLTTTLTPKPTESPTP